MTARKFKKVSLPEALIGRITDYIETHPEAGFLSPSDLVRIATIDYLKCLKSPQ